MMPQFVEDEASQQPIDGTTWQQQRRINIDGMCHRQEVSRAQTFFRESRGEDECFES